MYKVVKPKAVMTTKRVINNVQRHTRRGESQRGRDMGIVLRCDCDAVGEVGGFITCPTATKS
jgi:hypothetical protein